MYLLASILLEPNRWKPGRPPSLQASEWSEEAARAGFAGWELFENHYRKADKAEQSRLESGPLPVRILNTYEEFKDAERAELLRLIAVVRRLRVQGLKFNTGADRSTWPTEFAAIGTVGAEVSPTRLICECHPGTSLELPESVREFESAVPTAQFDIIIHPFLLTPEEIGRWGCMLPGRIRHAHIQMRSHSHPNRFIALSDDAPRARDALDALAATGFQGTFSLEFAAPTGRSGETPRSLFNAAVRDLEFLKENWRPNSIPDALPKSQSVTPKRKNPPSIT